MDTVTTRSSRGTGSGTSRRAAGQGLGRSGRLGLAATWLALTVGLAVAAGGTATRAQALEAAECNNEHGMLCAYRDTCYMWAGWVYCLRFYEYYPDFALEGPPQGRGGG